MGEFKKTERTLGLKIQSVFNQQAAKMPLNERLQHQLNVQNQNLAFSHVS